MSRPRILLIVLGLTICGAILLFAFLINHDSNNNTSNNNAEGAFFLSNRRTLDIEKIHIKNRFNEYDAFLDDGNLIIADLPFEQVNDEYAQMLLDEAAKVMYITIVSQNEKNSARYGLENPAAEVDISYRGGETLSLVFGDEEKISRGRYFYVKDPANNIGELKDVLMMENGRSVRFFMPLKQYINYEIVPFAEFPSPLSAIKKLTLSGKAYPVPIVIEEVRSDNEQQMRQASSFGAATHLIYSPGLHEIDQKEGIAVFASLTGILNKEVLAYNCTDEELAAYGFGEPYVRAQYDFKKAPDSPVEHIILEAARYKGDYILKRDKERVVHIIENEAFLETKYERLVMRWFLTPFITDLHSLELRTSKKNYNFMFSGETNNTLEVTLGGQPVDIRLFRKFYSLLISAANDGILLAETQTDKPPLLSIVFNYKDTQKPPDTMRIFEGTLRRLNVEVNGKTEFAMLQRYLTVVSEAAKLLENGEDFTTDW